MIPWLLVADLISQEGRGLAAMVEERMARFPCSGEINFTVDDAPAVIAAVEAHFEADKPAIDRTDGVSMEFADWRFNLRSSNTEPLVRLNVEARGDADLVQRRVDEISAILKGGA